MLHPLIAQSMGLTASAGSPATTTTGDKLEKSFKTLEHFVNARTEGVKLKNYQGSTDRLVVVQQSVDDMKANPETRWAFDFLAAKLPKSETRGQLIKLAKASRISATILAYFIGANGKDRRSILKDCGSKVDTSTPATPSNGAGKPAGSTTGTQRSSVSPKMIVTTQTTAIYSAEDAARHVASLGGNQLVGAGNGSAQQHANQMVGATN